MAKVIREIELTEEEAQTLLKAVAIIKNLTDELGMTSARFYDKFENICIYDDDSVSVGQDLNGKFIGYDYDNYEFKILERCDIEER